MRASLGPALGDLARVPLHHLHQLGHPLVGQAVLDGGDGQAGQHAPVRVLHRHGQRTRAAHQAGGGEGLAARVTMYTTVWGAEAAAVGIKNRGDLVVYPLQTLHAQLG